MIYKIPCLPGDINLTHLVLQTSMSVKIHFVVLDDDLLRSARTYFNLGTLKWTGEYHAVSLDNVKDVRNNIN